MYVAVVIDVWSRRTVGGPIGEDMRTERMFAAFDMALAMHKPENVIHHSGQGSQYASLAFCQRCQTMGVPASMGSRGDAYDSAMAESFFASLKCELIDRCTFKTRTEARLSVFTWIDADTTRAAAIRPLDITPR